MAAAGELTCTRHGKPTRITCVTCDTPICPECAIRTPVGYKCPDHATKPPAPRRSRASVIAIPLIILGVVGFAQLARTTGRGDPVTPPCPTETAPDVGIGPETGGGHWVELASSGLCGRYDAAVAWTGTELLVWGGESCAGAACPTHLAPHLADGAAYLPVNNAWRKLPASPLSARAPGATVWTGTEMIVWGGVAAESFFGDGAAYDPSKDRWRSLAPSPLRPRNATMAVWTGREVLVWGGADAENVYLDGAAYDPAADRWRPMAEGPLARRSSGVAVWTGRELVIWSGVDLTAGVEHRDGAAYDPAANRWRPLAASPLAGRDDAAAVWTGRELVIWGGNTVRSGLYPDGAAYDPATDRWRSLPRAPVVPRTATAAVWTGVEMLVWGGIGPPGSPDGLPGDPIIQPRTQLTPVGDGAAYNPATNAWRMLEPVSLLGRGFPITAWDGQGMIVWGGLVVVSSPASASDGVRYTP